MNDDISTVLDPWSKTFVGRLRVLDVRGSAIGDALQVVETHCADTGESPQEAFGDPAAYADSLAATLPPGATTAPTTALQAAVLTGGTGVALIALTTGLSGLITGGLDHLGPITTGDALQVALLAAGGAVIPQLFTARAGRAGTWLVGGVLAAMMIAVVALPPIFTSSLFTVPAWALLALAILVAVGTWVPVLRDPRLRDAITDPVRGEERITTPRWARIAVWTPAALLVVSLVIAGVLTPR